MKLGSLGRTLARMTAPLRRDDRRYTDLAKRIEKRAHLLSMETHAYVDHRMSTSPAETSRQIEARSRLASQEAKAYADDAIHSLSMAIRAMTKVLAGMNRRVDAMEAAQSETRGEIIELGGGVTQTARKNDDGLLNLSTDMASVETALREIDARLGAVIRHVDMPSALQTRGLRPPTPTDDMPARPQK